MKAKNVTAEIPRDIVVAAANAAISRKTKELDGYRAGWMAEKKGKRYGFLWLKKWDNESLNREWHPNHFFLARDVMNLTWSWPRYCQDDIKEIKRILEMAKTKHIETFRFDYDSLKLLGLMTET